MGKERLCVGFLSVEPYNMKMTLEGKEGKEEATNSTHYNLHHDHYDFSKFI
jgi:hypothetical protein